MNGFSVGRTVNFVLKSGDPIKRIPAEVRAAMIVGIRDQEKGLANLFVMLDRPNDVQPENGLPYFMSNYVPFDAKATTVRTWHFPKKS